MNYRTKIPIPHTDIILPVNTLIEPEYNDQQWYRCKINGNVAVFEKSIVESNPDIFEPERSWSDEEMIEFKYRYLTRNSEHEKADLDFFAKSKGK